MPSRSKNHFHFLVLAVIVFAVFVVYLPSLYNGFVNWDDEIHLLKNLTIRGLDWEHLQSMFNQRLNKIYIPLTSLSFAIEYKFFGFNPFVYHLTNLLLHLSNVALVFFLGYRLGLAALAAGVAALLFGIHPMHVESVAWVTERKDVLYAFFYLLSLHRYLVYLDDKKKKDLVVCFIFGTLSMLAKPMALSLPLVIFLLDWFIDLSPTKHKEEVNTAFSSKEKGRDTGLPSVFGKEKAGKKRRFNRSSVTEKIPLILILAAIGFVTYSVHARVPGQDVISAALTWVWTFVFYLRQFFLPTNLLPIYKLPHPVSLMNLEFALSLLVFVLLLVLVYRLRKERWVVFAAAFYFLSIFFILRLDDMRDTNVVADRFMYLPSLGLGWCVGYGLERFLRSAQNSSSVKNSVIFAVVVVMAVWVIKTHQQIGIWKDSFALWQYELKFEPNEPIALNDLATAYRDQEDYKDSIKKYLAYVALEKQRIASPEVSSYLAAMSAKVNDLISMYQRAIVTGPDFVDPVYNLGHLYRELGQTEAALKEYERAIQIDPTFKDTYFSLGNLYRDKGEVQKAIEAYSRTIAIDPENPDVYVNVVKAYNDAIKKEPQNEAYTQARASIIEAYTSKAFGAGGNAKAFFNLGVLYGEMGDFEQAIRAYHKAIELKSSYASAYYNLGNIYEARGQDQEAMKSYQQAVRINPGFADAYMNWGNLLGRMGRAQEAVEKYRLAIKANPRYSSPYFNLGFLYSTLGENKKASDTYLKSIELDPNQPQAYYNLGNIFAKIGDGRSALQYYQIAIALDPSYVDAFVNLALLYYRLKDYKAALKYFDEARVLGYIAPEKVQKIMDVQRE